MTASKLFAKLFRRTPKTYRHPKPAARTRLGLTALEGRDVPAVVTDGVLVIDGTDGPDTVYVSQTIPATWYEIAKVQVVHNGTTQTFSKSLIRTDVVRFRGNGGHDSFQNAAYLYVDADGGGGRDTLSGGPMDDTLVGGTNDDSIYGNEGDDRVSGGQGADELRGGAGNDVLAGDGDNDTMRGGPGDDSVSGNDGYDLLYGDNNAGTAGGVGADRLFGGADNDVLVGEGGNDSLYGGAGADALYGNDGADRLWGDYGGAPTGGEGDDTLLGGAGNDRLLGEGGGDFLHGDLGNDRLDGGNGPDRLGGYWVGTIFVDEPGNDTVLGGTNNDWSDGGSGNDTMDMGGGDDFAAGGTGNDTLRGGDQNDTLHGWQGDDMLLGGAGNDTLLGQDDQDTLNGGPDADHLNGGSGSDALIAIDGGFADTVVAGHPMSDAGGFDTVWADQAGPLVRDAVSGADATLDRVHRVFAFRNGADATLDGDAIADPDATRDARGNPIAAGYRNFRTRPLFSDIGPSLTDVTQQNRGDCGLMATAAAIAHDSPQVIRRTVADAGDGTYLVSLGANFYRVDADLPTGGAWGTGPRNAGLGLQGSLWVAIVEKAFTHFRTDGANHSYRSLDAGWPAEYARAFNLTGVGTADFGPMSSAPNAAGVVTTTTTGTAAALGNRIRAEWNVRGRSVTIATDGVVPAGSPIGRSHCWAVTGVNADAAGTVTSIALRNPHGSSITVSVANIFAAGVRLTWGNA